MNGIIDRIENALDGIRPALREDGGDVEVIGWDDDGGIVHLRLTGACSTCPISATTVKQGIERRLLSALPEVRGVLAVA